MYNKTKAPEFLTNKNLHNMCKNVLVVLSENFVDEKRESAYFSSARELITKGSAFPTKITFHNKKTDSHKDLKDQILKRPDVILFDCCGKATIKKTTENLCSKVKSKTLFCSIRSEHEISNVSNVKNFTEAASLIK